MYTQCPKCETTFKLGAGDLRQANGKVRCGDCNTVFNALEYLAEDVAAATDEVSGTELPNDGWTTSSSNPNGDVNPDIDEYEKSAYVDETETEAEHTVEVDEEDEDEYYDEDDADDDGAILYIDHGREDPLPDDADDSDESSLDSEFDDDIWDQIPGVGNDPEYSEPDDNDPDDVEIEATDDEAANADLMALEDDDEDGDEDGGEADDEVDGATSDEPVDESEGENLEFNVPEDKWNNFFGPLPKGQVAAVWQPPALSADETASSDGDDEADSWEALSASEPNDDEDSDTAEGESNITPQWKTAPQPAASSRLIPIGSVLLLVVLVTQLIHYNRDSLAADPTYGPQLRAFYASVGGDLYPNWDIDDYEIRGSEAIAGETGADVLDIRAQLANIGDHAVGLPRLRVVLRDRWSNPVAAQDFGAEEYALDNLPADRLLQAGAVIGAHVSIRDPGSGAQGFELELCLPRRSTGLECTGQPFQ